MTFDDANPVTLTMKQVYWIVGALGAIALALLLGFWGIGTWTVGGVREDV
jgi:hypothetical protein